MCFEMNCSCTLITPKICILALGSLPCFVEKTRSEVHTYLEGALKEIFFYCSRAWKNVLFREKIKILISLQKGTLAVPNTTIPQEKLANTEIPCWKSNEIPMQHLDPIWALLITYYYITYRMKTWSLLALFPTFHPHFVAQIPASVFDTQSALHYLTDQGCLEAMLYVNLDLVPLSFSL